jgi:hypothetical protein
MKRKKKPRPNMKNQKTKNLDWMIKLKKKTYKRAKDKNNKSKEWELI